MLQKTNWYFTETSFVYCGEKEMKCQSLSYVCDLLGCSPSASSVHVILQVRILEWVAILFSKGSSPPRDQTWVCCLADRFFTLGAIRTDCGQKAKSGKFKVVKSCSSCSGERQRQSPGREAVQDQRDGLKRK